MFGSLNAGQAANSLRRPSVTACASSGPKSLKNRNGVEAAHSSPMNSSGIAGASSSTALAACTAAGGASAEMRSPSARLPIWSWFCRKSTNAVAGSAALGSPRAAPPRCGEGSPW